MWAKKTTRFIFLLIRSPAKLRHPKPSPLTTPLPFLLMDEVPPSPSSPPPPAVIPLPEPSYRSPQTTPPEDVPPESSDAGRVKKHAWKRPSNGLAEVGAAVIGGAASWPALSESAKASPKPSSSDALKSISIAPPSVSTVGFCCFFCLSKSHVFDGICSNTYPCCLFFLFCDSVFFLEPRDFHFFAKKEL